MAKVNNSLGFKVQVDGNGSKYIQWEQPSGGWKRAWIQHRSGERDWAGTGRYLIVARTGGADEGPTQGPDFPVDSKLTDEQIIVAFIHAVSAVTGSPL